MLDFPHPLKPKYLTRWVLWLSVVCVAWMAPKAALAQFRFDSWTTDNGLPQVSVNAILQTRDGFLWFTTYGGLVRYDGLRFQVFNTGNTSGLRTGRLGEMFEDKDGNLWIATEGQGLTKYHDGIFHTYTTEDGLPANEIQRLEGDANGTLMVTASGTVVKWSGRAFIPYSTSSGEPISNLLQRLPNGDIWYAEGSRLRKFQQGQITTDLPFKSRVLRAFEDSQHRVWIAVDQSEELYLLKDGNLTTFGAREGYLNLRYIRAYEDRQGRVWFGSYEGLALFEGGKFTRFTHDDGLVRGGVTNIYQDREGTIWVGSSGGLSRLTQKAITAYSVKDGIVNENVYPIYEDRQGRIWIGSWGGLSLYEHGAFRNAVPLFTNGNESIAGALISSLFEDREGNLWVGTWGTIFRRAPDGKITVLRADQMGGHVRAITQDRDGTLWFGAANGLFKTLKMGPAATDFQFQSYALKDGLAGKEVMVIHEDRRGQLWIGTDGGVTVFKNGKLVPFSEKDGFAGGIVRTIIEDHEGIVWIGMYDSGLYRFGDGKLTRYTTSEGLFDNGAFQIVPDDRGDFWISCNLGIYRVRKAELNDFAAGRIKRVTAIPYNRRDGMLNSECNGGMQPAGIKARDGRIWFPTQQGVAVVNPAAVPFNSQPPPVVIESLNIDTDSVPAASSVELKPGQAYLEIHYSGLSFINPELVRFKYKLDGFDADWIDPGTRRTAYYSRLPPGSYRFTVIAANRDGVWNNQGAIIQIRVLPPFWRTWWFLSAAVLIIVLVVLGLFRWRIRSLKAAQAAREAFSRQLIESQESERRRIAAELHDSLGQSLVLIRNWALLGKKALPNVDQAGANLDEISDASSSAINEVREIAYNLGPYQLERLGLARTIQEMIEKVGATTGTRFAIAVDEFDGAFSKQAETSVYRIVQEAVNNIVKHSQATQASVVIKRDATRVTMTINDNGKGFSPQASRQGQPRGFGLLGLEERVRMLGGNLAVHSSPGQGTRIEITLPALVSAA